MLVRLVYTSRSPAAIDSALLDNIFRSSQLNNAEHGITGALCVDAPGQVFLQVLEGSRPNVNHLYNVIVRDNRHNDILLLDYAEIRQRQFFSWRMGRVDIDKVNRSVILRYSEKPQLDPYTMTGDAAVKLLEELASSAAVSSHP